MLALYIPERKDLWFREKMLSDSETMSYNHAWGGVIPFPEERWEAWYEHWIVRSGEKRFYRYVRNEAGEFVGETAYHWDEDLPGYTADVIIFAKYRGRGYGSRALDMLSAAAKENGVKTLYDDIAIDNPAAGMFLRHGFREEYRTGEKIILRKDL